MEFSLNSKYKQVCGTSIPSHFRYNIVSIGRPVKLLNKQPRKFVPNVPIAQNARTFPTLYSRMFRIVICGCVCIFVCVCVCGGGGSSFPATTLQYSFFK